MQVSARVLGKDYGLTAEEMNLVLLKLGFLEGEPGNYNLTEKAFEYAVENEYHRGTGGYSYYNRYWTTRTFDDSIKKVLNVTSELIDEVRNEISTKRAARCAALAIARAKANSDFLAKQAAEQVAIEAAKQAELDKKELIANLKKTGKVSIIVTGSIVVGYGIYKVTPRVKAWLNKRKSSLNRNIK